MCCMSIKQWKGTIYISFGFQNFFSLTYSIKVNTKLCVCASHTLITVSVRTKVLNGKTGCFREDCHIFYFGFPSTCEFCPVHCPGMAVWLTAQFMRKLTPESVKSEAL